MPEFLIHQTEIVDLLPYDLKVTNKKILSMHNWNISEDIGIGALLVTTELCNNAIKTEI